MAIFNKGYENIKVKLLNFDAETFAKKCYQFGRFGSDSYKFPQELYDEKSFDAKNFVDELIGGTTFPKYAFCGTRLDFSIEGISRICLAQLTRDPAIFCSESHGLRPLSQEFNIPLNIINDDEIMDKVIAAQKLLEQAYVLACEKEIPYPESRYICLHSQTISVSASFMPIDFVKSCYSRTNNSFCDELNYVYRKMYFCIVDKIRNVQDENSNKLLRWLFNEKKCINDSYYTRTNVFNGDFLPSKHDVPVDRPAQNDWRRSCWREELMNISINEPYLLTIKEKSEIEKWYFRHDSLLPTTYDPDSPRVAKNAIKTMEYYDGQD